MKKIYALLFILLSTAVFAQNPHWEWVSGVESSYAEPAKALATDAQGNMYTYSAFTSDIITDAYELHNTNPQTQDSFFAKLNNQGQLLWINKIGGAGSDTIWGMDTDANGNVYLTGTYTNGITIGNQTYTGLGTFFAKYNTNGQLVWVKNGSFTFMYALRVDSHGNIYAAGGFQGTFTYDTTTLNYDAARTSFIIKLDTDGNSVWAGVMEGPQSSADYNSVMDIEIDSAGNVYTAGTFHSSQMVFGNITLSSPYSSGYFFVKYNASGIAQWGKTSGNNTCANVPYDIALDSTGNVYLTGNYCGTISFGDTTLTSAGGSKFFIAKFDTNGVSAWVKSTLQGGSSVVHSADFDENDNLIIGGTFFQGISFGNNVMLSSATSAQYVAFYNTQGLAQWAVATGEIDVNNTVSVKAMGNHTIYTAGHMQIPSLTFGDITYTKTGQNFYNIWMGKLVYEDVAAAAPQFSKAKAALYPNPVTNILTVQSETPVELITIADCNGRTVAQLSNANTITTSALSNGIYFVSVTTATGKSTHKIVKN